MGATGWRYFVPYEAEISAALHRLREDVFARGDYMHGHGVTEDERKIILEKVRPEMDPWMQKVQEEAAKLQEPFRTLYLEGAERIKGEITGGGSAPRKPKRKPKTIEKLLESQGESGTHSILDILCISPDPKFGAISARAKINSGFASEGVCNSSGAKLGV